MSEDQTCSKFAEATDEPLFMAVPKSDPDFQAAHQRAAQTLPRFIEHIFDWMVLDQGRLDGGFTLRTTREKLPEAEREAFDRFIGVSSYQPLPS